MTSGTNSRRHGLSIRPLVVSYVTDMTLVPSCCVTPGGCGWCWSGGVTATAEAEGLGGFLGHS